MPKPQLKDRECETCGASAKHIETKVKTENHMGYQERMHVAIFRCQRGHIEHIGFDPNTPE